MSGLVLAKLGERRSCLQPQFAIQDTRHSWQLETQPHLQVFLLDVVLEVDKLLYLTKLDLTEASIMQSCTTMPPQ